MTTTLSKDRLSILIEESDYISRDLSWLQFNYRVLDQAKNEERTIFERLKFFAITASNLDEFFMIRVGSLYNYLDYGKQRIDYSGLREIPFRKKLLLESQIFFKDQTDYYLEALKPLFEQNNFEVLSIDRIHQKERERTKDYFKKFIHPMLTPMVYDGYHTFPVLMNKVLTFGVVTKALKGKKEGKKLSFVQIPQNLPRFFEITRRDKIIFVPIEEIIADNIEKLFRNVSILGSSLFRITRNGDFTLEESDDIEANFIEELQSKLQTRKTGRVVRIELIGRENKWIMKTLKDRWELDDFNIFITDNDSLLDFTAFWQIVNHPEFADQQAELTRPVPPLSFPSQKPDNIFDLLKSQDILLHMPYNSMEPVLELLEKAADDPGVLAIKLTIYRLAKDSRVTSALLKAAENGKHVSVLFEVKARFDEENNMKEAKKLQKAGCFVIYGIGSYKTHTKLLLIVRKEGKKVTRYVHMSSGNYNENTSRLYTDLGLMSTNEVYAEDISEFFNVITGHSRPNYYEYLITAPGDMRNKLIELIRTEAQHAKNGLSSGIVLKINSLQDKELMEELYLASSEGVPIKLIVRGICCLRPGRQGLSEKIEVVSIVGDYLEHSRIYYFHNLGNPKVYGGSADIMVRSFDRRIESLFLIVDETCKRQAINILNYNLKDNVNTYIMNEDGNYLKKEAEGEKLFNIHHEFFNVTMDEIMDVRLFD